MRGNRDYNQAIRDYNEAIRLDSKSPAWNQRAWLQATCPDEKYRDGKKAVADATRACELTSWKDATNLDTLAAAYAESENFDEAVKWQEQAIAFASPAIKATFESRIVLYRDGKPYREVPNAKVVAE